MSFDGIGALPLLGSPFLFHVRLTLKKTVAEHAVAIEEIVEKARHGMVPVSGFISPGEKEALRRLKAEPRARFVKLLPYTLPSRYDPSAEDSREIAAGRLLILSCFRDTPGISSLDMKRNRASRRGFAQSDKPLPTSTPAPWDSVSCAGPDGGGRRFPLLNRQTPEKQAFRGVCPHYFVVVSVEHRGDLSAAKPPFCFIPQRGHRRWIGLHQFS